MGCGMVRKVDELGRVVIPKEMRRILNIKSGSSIEMSINNNNQVVLEKFFEVSNIYSSAENLANLIFDELSLPCLVCDDEKVIICKGLNKKDFLNKKLLPDFKVNNKSCEVLKEENFLCGQSVNVSNTYFFTITSDGFDSGYVVVVDKDNKLTENSKNNIILLTKFLSSFLKF